MAAPNAPKRMSDADLKALVDSELRRALGVESSKLSEQRRKAMAYYYAEPEGDLAPPEIEGRSKVVSPDVRNTIESMLPQIVVKFIGGDKVVQFDPTKPGDESKADAATKYLNHIFLKKHDATMLTTTWAKDGMLQKRGILKVWWDTRTEETREEYKGQTPVQLALLMRDPEIEPIEQAERPDETEARRRAEMLEQLTQQLQQAWAATQQGGGPGQPPAEPEGAMQPGQPPRPPQGNPALAAVQQLQQQIDAISQMPPAVVYDVAFKRSRKGGKLSIEPVPSDEFIISREAKTIGTARLVGHKFKRTLSELRSMGYKNVDRLAEGNDTDGDSNVEKIERDSFDDSSGGPEEDDTTSDSSQTRVTVRELYMRVDYDGDGIAELRKITRCGSEILDNEVVDEAPFVTWCPVPIPHKFFGMSIADLAMEGQKTKTSIRRGQLDNMYLQVNGRYFAVTGKVELDDLLDSRPGGVVRMTQAGMAGRLDQGMGDMAGAAAMFEQEEAALENSTGWTRYSQGNDGKGLNETFGGVKLITNKADMRTDLVTRMMAQGFIDLFRLMLKLVCQNQDKAEQIQIAGEWVAMDPREWTNQFDISPAVGLGVGDKDQQVAHLMGLRALAMEGLQNGTATPQNVYELDVEIAKTMGFQSGARFFNDPKKNPPPQQPNPLQAQMQVEQMKAEAMLQIEREKMQSQERIEAMKAQQQAQVDQLRAQMQQQTDLVRQQAEADKARMEAENKARLDAIRMEMEERARVLDDGYRRWKDQLDSATRIEVANIGSKAKLDNPATAAATNEIATEVTQ
jgi:hypothetical protein